MTPGVTETIKNLFLFRSPSSVDATAVPTNPTLRRGEIANENDEVEEKDEEEEDEEEEDVAPPETQRFYAYDNRAAFSRNVDEVEASTTAAASLSRVLLVDHDSGGAAAAAAAATVSRATIAPLPQSPFPRLLVANLNVDLAEWMCHCCLSQRDPVWLQSDAQALEYFLRHSILPTPLPPDLEQRLRLTAFYTIVTTGKAELGGSGGEEEAENADDDDNGHDLTVRDWDALRQEFTNLETQFRTSQGRSLASVPEMYQLLGVQHALAALTADFQLTLNERPRNVEKQTRDALENYYQELERIFFGEVPEDLLLCAPGEAPTSSRGIDRVLLQIRKLVSEGPYSCGVLQDKVQVLVLDWATRFLSIPALVQIGYKGVAPTTLSNPSSPAGRGGDAIAAPRNDEEASLDGDVSAFGDDDNDEPLALVGPDDSRKPAAAVIVRDPDVKRRARLRSTSSSTAPGRASEEAVPRGGRSDAAQSSGRTQTIRSVPRNVKQPRRPSTNVPSRAMEPPRAVDVEGNSDSDDGCFHTQPLPQLTEFRDDDNGTSPNSDGKLGQVAPTSSLHEKRAAATQKSPTFTIDTDSDDDETVDPDANSRSSQQRGVVAQRSRSRTDDGGWARRNDKRTQRTEKRRSTGDSDAEESRVESHESKRARLHSPRSDQAQLDRRLSFTEDENASGGGKANAYRSRAKFTEDETNAIREGLAKFGKGNWSKLKAWAGTRLANRTAVQIKDKCRTMERTNDL